MGVNIQPSGVNGKASVYVRFIPLDFDPKDSDASARKLVRELRPEWNVDSQLEFVRFTDGITNTLLKAIYRRPGLTKDEIDQDAMLLRAYGHGTDVLIDRQRETQNHELLTQYGLAPELLARFQNGIMYRFIRGRVTASADLPQRPIYLAVARRLAEWHARVPCIHSKSAKRHEPNGVTNGSVEAATDLVAPGKPAPNVWTVMQKWLLALPRVTDAERQRQGELQKELAMLVEELSQRPGLGQNSLVFAHCDLLSGNIIVEPKTELTEKGERTTNDVSVHFIDYEYGAPSPAAFDIANHFAEWGGFDCDYNMMPTRSQRTEFIREYIRTYFRLLPEDDKSALPDTPDEEAEARKLFCEVDHYRGLPGFYWGIWALIQATISHINFDYASYAEVRLGEYWAWRNETTGKREAEKSAIPLREERWAKEA